MRVCGSRLWGASPAAECYAPGVLNPSPTLREIPAPVVLVVEDERGLVQRCTQALEPVGYVRVRSCVHAELETTAAALRPHLVVVSHELEGFAALGDTRVIATRSGEPDAELGRRIVAAIQAL
jgi:hypothetical protein